MMILSLFLMFSPMAMAQDDDMARAEELFLNGQALFEDEEYKAAITAWQKGYDISEMPDFLKNIALAQEALGQYDEAIQTLNEYRALASFSDQEDLKKWMADLEEKQKQAETLAQERKSEAQRLEEAKRLEQEKIEEEKRLAKEAELAKEQELLRQKEELLKKEQELANQKGFQMPPKLPMWTSIAGTALASGAVVYFTINTNGARESLESNCEWNSQFCLENGEFDFQNEIDGYNDARTGQIVASGLVLTFGSLAAWQVSKNISATPTSITWSTTW